MAQVQTMAASTIKVYINGIVMPNISSLSFSLSNGEEEIWGIDSLSPQEISPSKTTVSGTITGMRIKASGDAQARRMIPLQAEVMEGNYWSLRVEDIDTKFNLLFIPYAKVSREDVQIQAKGLVKFSLNFVGILAAQELDIVK